MSPLTRHDDATRPMERGEAGSYAPRILVVDDDLRFCRTMERILEKVAERLKKRGQPPLETDTANDLATARRAVQQEDYDVVFLDVNLPDGNGLHALPDILGSRSRPEVIILTGQGDPDGAELAIEEGAWDYLLKPASVKQTMLCVERAIMFRAQKARSAPHEELDLGRLVGISPRMQACHELLALAAHSSANVLVTGETGTGKELVARIIHDNSTRKHRQFVPVDGASMKLELAESVLFGHRRGAFTGAGQDRTGLVTVAHGGTLFLDEVGDMDLPVQKTLLRVLQERTYRPVGDTREMTSDFRLIAATNRDLAESARRGEFRDDLLYRLKTIHLELPPLRKREGDLRLLALFRLNQLATEYGEPGRPRRKAIAPETMETMAAYRWPGNVRELFAVLEGAYHQAGESGQIIPNHLPAHIRIAATRSRLNHEPAMAVDHKTGDHKSGPPNNDQNNAPKLPESPWEGAITTERPLSIFRQEMDSNYLRALREHTGGNVKEMLRISGCSQSSLYALLKKAGISLKD